MGRKTLKSLELELRDYAMTFPETREDSPWGHRAVKVRDKMFVVLGAGSNPGEFSMSVKLPASRDMAVDLPFAEPTGYGMGKSGWVTARLTKAAGVPMDLFRAWIDESYRAIAPKKLVKLLEGETHMSEKAPVGTIGWHDLTVEDAETVRDFYAEVAGWSWSALDMGGYSDFVMTPSGGGDAVTGVCHARGANAGLPAQWLMYIVVADIDRSIEACRARGGVVLAGPKSMGEARYCIIRDPAGAVCALYQH